VSYFQWCTAAIR